jgi:hypothetical protein
MAPDIAKVDTDRDLNPLLDPLRGGPEAATVDHFSVLATYLVLMSSTVHRSACLGMSKSIVLRLSGVTPRSSFSVLGGRLVGAGVGKHPAGKYQRS